MNCEQLGSLVNRLRKPNGIPFSYDIILENKGPKRCIPDIQTCCKMKMEMLIKSSFIMFIFRFCSAKKGLQGSMTEYLLKDQ